MTVSSSIYLVACVFVAAFVRGYTGFGFSLLAITSMSLMLPPVSILPSIFMMEIVASISLLPSIWKDIHWRSLALLWLGCLIGTPIGVHFLAAVPVAPMKVALGIAVLGAVALLQSGYSRKQAPSAAETVLTGGVAGLLNGAFGIVVPVIVFFFNSPAGAVVGRASLIAFFIGTDSMGVAFLAQQGLVTLNAFSRLLVFVPALIVGQWLGSRALKRSGERDLRRWVLRLLALLAVLTAAQGIIAIVWS